MARRFLSSKDIAERAGVANSTVLQWAQKVDADYIGDGRRKIYIFTEADYEKFLTRPGPGKRAKPRD